MKRLAVLLALVAGVSACSAEGDDFSVHLTITDVGEQSVTGEVTSIEHDEGWFTVGNTHQIHDNCDCHGFWNGHKRYGRVVAHDGTEILLSDLEPGQCLRLDGQIRADQEGKTSNDRPVYDLAQREPCG